MLPRGARVEMNGQRGVVRGFLKIGRDTTARKQAAEQLQQEYVALEQRVAERTAELSTLNANLERQIGERQRMEREREQVLRLLMTAQEEERRRISRDLHDQMGQQVTGLQLALKAVEDTGMLNHQARGHLSKAQVLATTINGELHELALELRPSSLDDLGLEAALASYIKQWAQQARVKLDSHIDGLDRQRLPMPISTT